MIAFKFFFYSNKIRIIIILRGNVRACKNYYVNTFVTELLSHTQPTKHITRETCTYDLWDRDQTSKHMHLWGVYCGISKYCAPGELLLLIHLSGFELICIFFSPVNVCLTFIIKSMPHIMSQFNMEWKSHTCPVLTVTKCDLNILYLFKNIFKSLSIEFV